MLDTVVSMLVLLVMIIPKKEISKILSIAVPSMQKNSLSNNPTVVPDNIWWMILIDIGICVVVTIAGIEIFKRSDLK